MLKEETSLLIVIDIQGNLARAAADRELLFESARKLIQGAKVFQLPIIVTEQIPEKLGATIPEIAGVLEGIGKIPKETFSCCANTAFMEAFKKTNRRQILLCGIESHICVYQTAMDLLEQGYEVHIVADAVSSRTAKNREIGINKMIRAGAHLTSTETVLFELLKTAGSDKFKDIFKIIK
ncbi:MAG TPA: hydrolase [Syntrophales bacterium]|jgi:nicotinamidase-related amidase|nr:hydrolase [Syntrophales bacterium]